MEQDNVRTPAASEVRQDADKGARFDGLAAKSFAATAIIPCCHVG